MTPTIFIEARSVDEALEKFYEDDDKIIDAVDKMVEKNKPSFILEYGDCRLYTYDGADDYDCTTRGEIEITARELVDEIGAFEVFQILRDE